MDQAAIGTTGVTLETNQNTLVKEILGEIVEWGAFFSSGCLDLQCLYTRLNATETLLLLAVVCCPS